MRIIFLGRRAHAVEALSWLVDEGHDVVRVVTPSGIGVEQPYWSPTVRGFAESRNLHITDAKTLYTDIEEPEESGLEAIDLAVSFLFSKRIRPSLVELPRFGCINFHPAPLPDYKGLGGYNFAILDKLREWAATAHYVDDNLDTGPIIEVRRFPFDWQLETAFSLELATRSFTIDLFKAVIRNVAQKGWLSTEVNAGGRYITRAEMNDAKRIDLESMSPEEVDLRTRAFWYPPFDGAYVEHHGTKYTLVSTPILNQLKMLHASPRTEG